MTEPQKNVLIIEDNLDNSIIYSTMLEYSGYRVTIAVDGEAGIDAAHREQPALILMDISIPVIDGWEATRRIKANPATAHIPIIALTARALTGDRERSEAAGCDGYVAKPAEPRTVLAEVQRFIGAPTSLAGE